MSDKDQPWTVSEALNECIIMLMEIEHEAQKDVPYGHEDALRTGDWFDAEWIMKLHNAKAALSAHNHDVIIPMEKLRAQVASAEADAAAARSVVRGLRSKLDRLNTLLEQVPGALSASFNAGCEEREAGSERRQARHLERVEALRSEIKTVLSESEAQSVRSVVE